MKVSRSVGYGLLALGYVARNQKKGECVLSQDISKKYKIPLEYLLKQFSTDIKQKMMRKELGSAYPLYQKLDEFQNLEGVQAKLPYSIQIH